MRVITGAGAMSQYSAQEHGLGHGIGFVPTMGALHNGHASLVKRALDECGTVVASVFVNPTQFNEPKDLERYPRTYDADHELLQSLGCHALFYPSVHEVYPHGLDAAHIDLRGLDSVMEGTHRPGHFNGVVQVVSRLFDLVDPDRSYFGEKDFQQVAIIRHMVRISGRRVRVMGCPTVREPDGLAMSSRNTLLSPQARLQALALYRCLRLAEGLSHARHWARASSLAFDALRASDGVTPEYLTIVDGTTLAALDDGVACSDPVVCAAAWVGGVRLIDNVQLSD